MSDISKNPVEHLLNIDHLNEILICSKEEIWYEQNGVIKQSDHIFYTDVTYNNFIHKISEESGAHTDLIKPYADGSWHGFRVHITAPPLTKTHTLSLRKQNKNLTDFNQILKNEWCDEQTFSQIKKSITNKENILFYGPTGSGKTTILNASLQMCKHHRVVSIEDTDEIILPNKFSVKLMTRSSTQNELPNIDQEILLKQALRMRPDRIVVGEIRGREAKDYLLALSTGHRGSMCTLHASHPKEALMRLEMLVQMAVPEWNLDTIRRLILLSIDKLICTQKTPNGWRFFGMHRISSLEQFGFTTEKCC